MTIRSIVLAAVTAFVVGTLPGAAFAVPCDSSEDCAAGSRCSHPHKGKPGVCVAAMTPKSAKSVHRIPCEDGQDCPVGGRCDHKPRKTGFCVGGSKK
jgi:hypothetical protein